MLYSAYPQEVFRNAPAAGMASTLNQLSAWNHLHWEFQRVLSKSSPGSLPTETKEEPGVQPTITPINADELAATASPGGCNDIFHRSLSGSFECLLRWCRIPLPPSASLPCSGARSLQCSSQRMTSGEEDTSSQPNLSPPSSHFPFQHLSMFVPPAWLSLHIHTMTRGTRGNYSLSMVSLGGFYCFWIWILVLWLGPRASCHSTIQLEPFSV
jgi:hypothetical protein